MLLQRSNLGMNDIRGMLIFVLMGLWKRKQLHKDMQNSMCSAENPGFWVVDVDLFFEVTV